MTHRQRLDARLPPAHQQKLRRIIAARGRQRAASDLGCSETMLLKLDGGAATQKAVNRVRAALDRFTMETGS